MNINEQEDILSSHSGQPEQVLIASKNKKH